MIVTTKIMPRYAETDQMGIIHHAVYPIWYELGRTEYFNKVGLRYDEIEKMGIMTPIVEMNCKYKMPAYYNKEVEVRTKLTKLTPVRFILEYNIYDKNNNLINTGTTTLAWADSKTFKIINIQKQYEELYNKLKSLVEEN